MRRGAGAALLAAALALGGGCGGGPGPLAERRLPADPGTDLVYVALGDSTVAGVGASRPELDYVSRLHERLRALYPRATVSNLGVSGATAADVVARQLEPALARRPHLVTLSVGPNDLTGGISPDAFAGALETIFERLAGETAAVVVTTLLPDLAVTPRFRRPETREAVGARTARFNEAVARTAGVFGVAVVDLHRASREEVPRRPELLAADGYHPSDAGYARWAELMWTVIEGRLPGPRGPRP